MAEITTLEEVEETCGCDNCNGSTGISGAKTSLGKGAPHAQIVQYRSVLE